MKPIHMENLEGKYTLNNARDQMLSPTDIVRKGQNKGGKKIDYIPKRENTLKTTEKMIGIKCQKEARHTEGLQHLPGRGQRIRNPEKAEDSKGPTSKEGSRWGGQLWRA